MSNTERAAYLRGLTEGLELDDTKKETKVIKALVDLVEDLAISIKELEEAHNDLADQVDEIDEDLASVEEDLYEDDEDEDPCEDCEEESCENCEYFDEDDCYYEVTCPSCGETICLNEQMIEDGSIDCPNCGEKLEFDLDDVVEEEEDKEDTEE